MSNTLNFTVSGNRLELKDGFTPVNTEHDYTVITVSFEQGSDWENCTLITAGFFVSADQISTVQPAVVSGLTCSFTIPSEILSSGVDEFHFGLTGSYTENESTVTAATNIVTINAQRGVLIGEAVDLSAYEKLLAAINAGLTLKEDTANKTTAINESNSNSNTLFPTINAVVQYLLARYYTKAQLNTEYWDTAVIPFFTDKFVTPEMFGAVGDGIADDSKAIQDAIDAAGTNKVVLMVGNYLTSDTIHIVGEKNIYHVGTIRYTRNGSAIKIEHISSSCNLKFGKIDASPDVGKNIPGGNGIEFYASDFDSQADESGKNRVQYVKLEFGSIKALDKCIYLNLDVESRPENPENENIDDYVGWINEIVISNGQFARGNYGIYGDAKGYPKMNNIKLYNVSIEGITNKAAGMTRGTAAGIYMANGCKRWSFVNMRYAEKFDYLMKTVGSVDEFMFYGSQWWTDTTNPIWDLSDQTFGVINIPTKNAGRITGMTRAVNNGNIGRTPKYEIDRLDTTVSGLSTTVSGLSNTVSGLGTTVTGTKSVTDRFTITAIPYDPTGLQTLIDHGIIPAATGYYFVVLCSNSSGDNLSVYIVRVKNVAPIGSPSNIQIDIATPIYEGESPQAPRVEVVIDEGNPDNNIYGKLKKNNSNSSAAIFAIAIKTN